MPPIPSTGNIEDDETRQLIDALTRRENDLVSYQIPRLRDCTESLNVQQRFATELREDLDTFTRQIGALELHAEDTLKKADRAAVKQVADAFTQSSQRIRKDMRAALLHSKRAIDARAKSNREKLFDGAVDKRNVEEKATDDALMKASSNVTEALQRTLGLMQGELERSVLSHQMLEQSTATLRSTSTQHDILSTATLTSRQLIRALEQADWLDRLLVLAALAFFILVALFIAKQRIIDRGLRVAFWWTRFLPGPGPVVSGGKAGGVKGMLEDVLMEEGSLSRLETLSTAVTTATTSTLTSTTDAVVETVTVVETLVQTLEENVQSSSASASTSLAEAVVSALSDETPTLTSILESIASSVSEELPHIDTLSSSTVPIHSEL